MIRKTITLICMATLSIGAIAQDTVLNRNITVEREFQPIVQSTGKINQRPMVIESLCRIYVFRLYESSIACV